ncbi:MAG: hypothetical protein WC718_01150 [Phycisphaerales bacterium]|jgi:ABC-type transporter Mla subunit MlaD
MAPQRNNILAGIFVLAGLALAVWASFVLADRAPLGGLRRFSVRFTIAGGAPGIKGGSPVTLAGQQIGRVVDVTFEGSPGDAAKPMSPRSVLVRVEVERRFAFYENARINIEKPLLGNLSTINISEVGDPATVANAQGGNPELQDNEVISGSVAPPGFLADAGLGPEQIEDIRAAIHSAKEATQRVNDLIGRAGPGVEKGIADAQAVIADVRENIKHWSERLDTISANAQAASERLTPMLDHADKVVANADGLVDDARAVIKDNRPGVDAAVKNIESASAKLDRETISLLNDSLKDARAALTSFDTAVTRVSALLTEQKPNIARTLANLRLTSDQLKLTAIEVRSQPWRLLHEPTTKELSSQVLYDATREYAEAASDLRAASDALAAAAAPENAKQAGAEGLGDLSAKVTEALDRYRKSEKLLLEKLVREK